MKLVGLLCGLAVCSSFLVSPKKADETTFDVNYKMDYSKGVPSELSLYSLSDKNNTTITSNESGVTVTHSNNSVNNTLYYGGLFNLGGFEQGIGDFEYSMTFKFNSYVDQNRWVGLVYHTNVTSSKFEGYMFASRVSGKVHQSQVNGTSFNDSLVCDATTKWSDKKEHTMKIISSGEKIEHYLDNEKVHSYNYSEYSGSFADPIYSGGFGFIVNKSSITISDITLKGNYGSSVDYKEIDKTIASTYAPDKLIATPFSVNKEVFNKDDLDAIYENETPTNLIVHVDENMNIVDKDGNSLDETLASLYDNEISGKIIPVVYIKDKSTADKFLEYTVSDFNVLDSAVMSDEQEVLTYLRKEKPTLRAIYDARNVDEFDELTILQNANIAQASVIVLPSDHYDKDIATYFHYRFKCTWVDVRKCDEINQIRCLLDGAYGVIAEDVKGFYRSYDKLDPITSSNFNILSRVPADVAHRGLCITNYENSLEAFIDASDKGATHIELDVQMSKDNQLVVMHDASIDRTTNGKGNVSSFTVDQLKNYKITKNINGVKMGDGVDIPTLEEVFEEFQERKTIIVVEIKTNSSRCASELRKLLDEYDMYGQAVVISFDRTQLNNIKNQIPEIATSDLNAYSMSNFAAGLSTIGQYNCGIDCHYGTVDDKLIRECAVRGIPLWSWTYGSYNELNTAVNKGSFGLTNNIGDYFKDAPARIYSATKYAVIKDDERYHTTEIEIKYETFAGNFVENELLGTPAFVSENDIYADVIYVSMYANRNTKLIYSLFTDVVRTVKESVYLSESDLATLRELSNKKGSQWSAENKALVEKYIKNNSYLYEEDKAGIDLNKLQEEIKNYSGKKGCKGEIIGTSVIFFIAISSLLSFVILKKKEQK
ncbi:MAG: hypothetical protein IJ656_00095 [Bacilli bacterium]|nr:hypothetical protein [Bacilli bacterium]